MRAQILIIRFSSFGDIVQSFASISVLRREFPNSEIHFLTRSDFHDLVKMHPGCDRIIPYDKKTGFLGLILLIKSLRAENYSLVYDAHNNVRSFFTRLLLFKPGIKWITRSKFRFRRFLLFRLGKNLFPKPFKGAESFVTPLGELGISTAFPQDPEMRMDGIPLPELPPDIANRILIAPSAAWELKRWPIEFWKDLIQLCPLLRFAIVGGPEDQFCQDIESVASDRVVNLAGKLSLTQTYKLASICRATISGDTGVLHMADSLRRPTIALMGPSAFGFPSRPTSVAMARGLWCQPCSKDGRGRCKNDLYKRCLVELTPAMVKDQLLSILGREQST